jgi:hypothetical protein
LGITTGFYRAGAKISSLHPSSLSISHPHYAYGRHEVGLFQDDDEYWHLHVVNQMLVLGYRSAVDPKLGRLWGGLWFPWLGIYGTLEWGRA